jgi:hypothetical protein
LKSSSEFTRFDGSESTARTAAIPSIGLILRIGIGSIT